MYNNGSSSSDGGGSIAGSNSSSDGQAEVGYNGVAAVGDGARAGTPLQSDGKGGLKGGRMVVLKHPAVVDASVQ
jgi:hypothetical protein